MGRLLRIVLEKTLVVWKTEIVLPLCTTVYGLFDTNQIKIKLFRFHK